MRVLITWVRVLMRPDEGGNNQGGWEKGTYTPPPPIHTHPLSPACTEVTHGELTKTVR